LNDEKIKIVLLVETNPIFKKQQHPHGILLPISAQSNFGFLLTDFGDNLPSQTPKKHHIKDDIDGQYTRAGNAVAYSFLVYGLYLAQQQEQESSFSHSS
jgi:hypothetical protein